MHQQTWCTTVTWPTHLLLLCSFLLFHMLCSYKKKYLESFVCFIFPCQIASKISEWLWKDHDISSQKKLINPAPTGHELPYRMNFSLLVGGSSCTSQWKMFGSNRKSWTRLGIQQYCRCVCCFHSALDYQGRSFFLLTSLPDWCRRQN